LFAGEGERESKWHLRLRFHLLLVHELRETSGDVIEEGRSGSSLAAFGKLEGPLFDRCVLPV